MITHFVLLQRLHTIMLACNHINTCPPNSDLCNTPINNRSYPKLGDLGFAKRLHPNSRTFTFCGTLGYGEQQL